MPRIQCPLCVLVLTILVIYWIPPIKSECYYEGERHEEGVEVPTAEPCLNCTCGRGVLLCYLRVCPKLPDPPPPGCVLLHRHRTCCPELICPDIPAGNRLMEARNEPSANFIDYDINKSLISDDGCISNGSVYGPGSAMASSSLCEYCYCLGGKQHCVKPKCLLPLDGCVPAYETHSCCPTHYNCTPPITTTSSTTTTPTLTHNRGGCTVDGSYYPEGGKVLGVGHSVCDNCYCIRGLLRCEPLACAPNLLGCTPVIKPGECCAASYNCSGVIEVQYLNYGHYPIVSKEYAKLRKEVQRIRPIYQSRWGHKEPLTEDTGQKPFYVIAETADGRTTKESRSFATTRHFAGNMNPSTNTPYYYFNSKTSSGENRNNGGDGNSNKEQDSVSSSSDNKEQTAKPKPVPELLIDFRRRPGSTTWNGGGEALGGSAVTNYEYQNQNYKRPVNVVPAEKPPQPEPVYQPLEATTAKTETENQLLIENSRDSNLKDEDYGNIFRILDALLDGRNNRRIDSTNTVAQNISANDETENATNNSSNNNATTDATTTENEPTTSRDLAVETETENLPTTTSETDSDTAPNGVPSTTIYPTTEEIAEDISTTDTTEAQKETLENSTGAAELTTNIINSTDCIEEQSSDSLPVEQRISLDNLLEELLSFPTTTTTAPEELTTIEAETSTLPVTTENQTVTETMQAETNNSATTPQDAKLSPEIEAILNITKSNEKKNEDYEYDYSEPSLPPSLPNLRIIPFVAADAVLNKNKMTGNSGPTESSMFGFANLFSPPIETEGGFVPKDPPPEMDPYYDTNYHSTTKAVDITSDAPVPSITNPTKTKKENCITEGREVEHGKLVSPEGACVVCMCFYGTVVCQQPQCPPPGPGCRRTASTDLQACCPHLVCDNAEAPTVVLDRMDVTVTPQEIVTVAEGVSTPDPFRDVIHTEPAPDLQSLIGDIMPYLVRHGATTPTPFGVNSTHLVPNATVPETTSQNYTSANPETSLETNKEPKEEEEEDDGGGFTLNKVFELLFSSDGGTDKPTAPPLNDSHASEIIQESPSNNFSEDFISKTETTTAASDLKSSLLQNVVISESGHDSHPNSVDSSSSVGLLKLAGCNIYGRMYRVGRIISELSGPCLECKCTEVGVQCRQLGC